MTAKTEKEYIIRQISDKKTKQYAIKAMSGIRLSQDEALVLYHSLPIPILGSIANYINTKKNREIVFYNKNIHIEPTNICHYNCLFCSYSKKKGDQDSWILSKDALRKKLLPYRNSEITEVHMVGGCHPGWNIEQYLELVKITKEILPNVHLKAFSAVEINYIAEESGLSYKSILMSLKNAGVESLPGGGAEIFCPEIRTQICPEKASAQKWLEIHKTAHKSGLSSNATMLYGHIEKTEHQLNHMEMIRELQDQTNGFMAFIPLKFRNKNNKLSYIKESSIVEDLKTYAISRIFLDNFQHVKAYWPMLGINNALLTLSFGTNDLDGTIEDPTKIYAMAGVKNKKKLTTSELKNYICQVNKKPVERNSLYRIVRK